MRRWLCRAEGACVVGDGPGVRLVCGTPERKLNAGCCWLQHRALFGKAEPARWGQLGVRTAGKPPSPLRPRRPLHTSACNWPARPRTAATACTVRCAHTGQGCCQLRPVPCIPAFLNGHTRARLPSPVPAARASWSAGATGAGAGVRWAGERGPFVAPGCSSQLGLMLSSRAGRCRVRRGPQAQRARVQRHGCTWRCSACAVQAGRARRRSPWLRYPFSCQRDVSGPAPKGQPSTLATSLHRHGALLRAPRPPSRQLGAALAPERVSA